MASIKSYTNAKQVKRDALAEKALLDAVLVDLAALRAAIVGITAQLDADGGVTDTDYAADNDPAALTLVE